jgi:hypothetical protein
MPRSMPDEEIQLGDEVVHQSHPGRFTVIRADEPRALNVYSRVLTIRSRDGVEMKVLDTTVRRLPAAAAG